jgi:hypothetical protein
MLHDVRTLAALKRTLKPGMQLTLVHTFRGDRRVRRTVAKVQSNAMACSGHGDPGDFFRPVMPNQYSWLYFGKASDYEATEKGFKFYERDDMHEDYVEYEWGHNL